MRKHRGLESAPSAPLFRGFLRLQSYRKVLFGRPPDDIRIQLLLFVARAALLIVRRYQGRDTIFFSANGAAARLPASKRPFREDRLLGLCTSLDGRIAADRFDLFEAGREFRVSVVLGKSRGGLHVASRHQRIGV